MFAVRLEGLRFDAGKRSKSWRRLETTGDAGAVVRSLFYVVHALYLPFQRLSKAAGQSPGQGRPGVPGQATPLNFSLGESF
jgi:hypothetical protein